MLSSMLSPIWKLFCILFLLLGKLEVRLLTYPEEDMTSGLAKLTFFLLLASSTDLMLSNCSSL